MRFSIDFFFRIFGAILGAVLFALLGRWIADLFSDDPDIYVMVLALVGILAGLVLTPFITTRPIRHIRQQLISMPPERLGAIIIGIFLGLIAAALLSFPLSFLPPPFQQIAPLAAAVVFCYLSVVILSLRQQDLRNFFGSMRPWLGSQPSSKEVEDDGNNILLDTSVIIDGRITDISKTGFIRATLVVPNFVLTELQHIADSPDTLRRNRGRRGLEVLSILQQDIPIPIRFTDMDVSEVRDVDSKLVALAREMVCPIMTNDYNLNRVAELQGVPVLNINDLANAVKAAYLPGEELSVKIIQEGKEYGQGVGYLDDGTMIVVEDGEDYINQSVTATVTKVLQTTAGRMIFARIPNHN
jgi:uncharacterized protein YacL